MSKAIYSRVSTSTQDLSRQTLNASCKVYEDKVSGTISLADRPQGSKLMNDIKSGKISEVEISSLSRLGRKMSDLLNIIEFFDEFKVNLIIKDLGLQSRPNSKANKMFSIIGLLLSNFSEMLREEMLESQAQAIAIKKAKGLKYHNTERKRETPAVLLTKYKNVLNDLKKGINDAQILKTNYIVYDTKYLNLTNIEKKRYRGKTISRNTLKKLKLILPS